MGEIKTTYQVPADFWTKECPPHWFEPVITGPMHSDIKMVCKKCGKVIDPNEEN